MHTVTTRNFSSPRRHTVLGAAPADAGDSNRMRPPRRHALLSSDGLSLYFDSEREGGQGGRDRWVARRT